MARTQHLPSILRYLWLLALVLGTFACGQSQASSSSDSLVYKLEKPATNEGKNALILIFPNLKDYLIRISGTGLRASVAMDQLLPAQNRIELQYDAVGTYTLNLAVALGDGTEFLNDSLTWEYNHETPPLPIVSFSEAASSDEHVFLLVSSSRGPSVGEIWVEGDVQPTQGQWYPIPNSGKVALALTAGEGIKSIKTRLRNQAGAESESIDLSIVRKDTPPKACAAVPIATTVLGDRLRLELSATNNGSMAYRVMGDVAKVFPFRTFEGLTQAEVILSAGAGLKNLTVIMRDEAETYCPFIPLQIRVDPSYQTEAVVIDQVPLWTDNPNVVVKLRSDALPSDVVEMFIEGGVEPSVNTFRWIPFQATVPVELTASEGHRFVIVQYRRAEQLSEKVADGIFLRPYIKIFNNAGIRELLLSPIVGLSLITIEGCQEIYLNRSYADRLPCTIRGGPITIRYDLIDGSSLTRSVLP